MQHHAETATSAVSPPQALGRAGAVRPGIPQAWCDAIRGALVRDPDHRTRSVADLRAALDLDAA